MKDPYQVLGVSRHATDEEINEAYRERLRKYQNDDSFQSKSVQEKIQELNEAYDQIILNRRSGSSVNENGNMGSGGNTFSDIRSRIQQGRIDDADQLLEGIPSNMRNAEWNFLKGTVLYRRGWLEEAYRHYSIAVKMDPSNREYRAALENINVTRNGQYRAGNRQDTGCTGCDICTGLLCTDCCCECMGGDFIRCC